MVDTINKADATINVTGYDVTYDGNVHRATADTVTGVNGEPLVGLDLRATRHTDAAPVDTWTFTDQSGNYNDNSGQISDSVSKVDLTVMAFDTFKIYDGSPAGFAWAVTGFVNGESLGDTSGSPDFTGSAVGAVNAGSYTITPTVARSPLPTITSQPSSTVR